MPLLTISDLLAGGPDVEHLLGRASMLSTMYENWLGTADGGESSRAPGIHASEISGCERRVVYSILGEKRSGGNVDATWRKRFKIGHAVHAMLQSDFAKMAVDSGFAITFQEELSVAPWLQPIAAKWDIYSHCDGLFTVRETWQGPALLRVALEIKTASPAEYEKLNKPKPEHIEQAHVYMACLDVPMTWLLYWNKGNQNYTGTDAPNFLVKFDPKLWAELETRFERVHVAAATGQLPEREEGVRCEFCAFAHVCQPTYLRKIAARASRGQAFHTRWEHR